MSTQRLYRLLAGMGLATSLALVWFLASAEPVQELALRRFFQTTMIQAISIAMLMLGLFFFSFWWARRAETEYLLLAVAGLVWSANNLQYILPRPDDPTLLAWYRALLEQLPIAWLNWLVFQFFARFLPERPRSLERFLACYVLLASVLVLPWRGISADTSLWGTAVYTLVGITSILLMARYALRHPCPELTAMAPVLLLCAGAGLHDWASRARWLSSERVPLIPYGGLLLFCTFLYAVQRRYVGAIRVQEAMSAELAIRLAARERELEVQHRHVLQLERTQAQTAERQRLVRDMHDGLGAHLGTSLMLAEQGQLGPAGQVQALREAVDDLRAVMDSLSFDGWDVAELLASVRHRWVPRLQAAGIQVDWPLFDALATPLSGEHALDLQRWLHEALANVLKHARASKAQVLTERLDEHLRITVQDDGIGFHPEDRLKPGGRGLENLALRAQRLGAVMRQESGVGRGTLLALEWPAPRA